MNEHKESRSGTYSAAIAAVLVALGFLTFSSPAAAASTLEPSLKSARSGSTAAISTTAVSTISMNLNATVSRSSRGFVASEALPSQEEPVVKRVDPAANQLRWITAALLALSATTFIGTFLFWRATRPGRRSESETAEEWFDNPEVSQLPEEAPLFATELAQVPDKAESELAPGAPEVVVAPEAAAAQEVVLTRSTDIPSAPAVGVVSPEPAEGVVVAPVVTRGGSASVVSEALENDPRPLGETGDPAAPMGRKARRKAASSTAIPAAEVLAALKAAETLPAPVASAPAPAPAPVAPAPERPKESRSIFDALSAVPDMQSSPVHFDDPPIPAPRQQQPQQAQQPPAERPARRSDRPESGLQRPRRDESDEVPAEQLPAPQVSRPSHSVPETPEESESGRRQLTTRENGPFNIEDEFEF